MPATAVEKWIESYFPQYLDSYDTEVEEKGKSEGRQTKDKMLGKLKTMSKAEINEWGNSEYNSQVEGGASKLALHDLNTSKSGKKITRNFTEFMTTGIKLKTVPPEKLAGSIKNLADKLVEQARKQAEKEGKLGEFKEGEVRDKISQQINDAAKKNAGKLGSLNFDQGITFDEMLSNKGTMVSALDARLGDNFSEAYLDPEEMCAEEIRNQRNDIKEQLFLTKKGGDRDLGRGRTTWDEATSESAFVKHLTELKRQYVGELKGAEYSKDEFLNRAKVDDKALWKLGNVYEEAGGKKTLREKIEDYSNKDAAPGRLKALKEQYEKLAGRIGKDKDAEVISTLELMSVTTEGGAEHNEDLYGKVFGLSKDLMGDPTEYFVKAVRHGKNANVRLPGSLASEVFETLAVPMVGGVSGTTVDFIAVLKDRAKKGKPPMSEKEIEAVAAAFMFSMVGAGHHSLVEMIAGAQQWGYFFDVPNPLTMLAQGKTAFDAMRNKGGKVVEDSSFLDKGNTITLPSYEHCLKEFEKYVRGLGIDTSGLLAEALGESVTKQDKTFDVENKGFVPQAYKDFTVLAQRILTTLDTAIKQAAKTPEPAQSSVLSVVEPISNLSTQFNKLPPDLAENLRNEAERLLAEVKARFETADKEAETQAVEQVKNKVSEWTSRLEQLAPPDDYPTEKGALAERAKLLNGDVFKLESEIGQALGMLQRMQLGGDYLAVLKAGLEDLKGLKEELGRLVPGRKTKAAPGKAKVENAEAPEIAEKDYQTALDLYKAYGKNWFTLKHEFQAGHITKAQMEMAWAYRQKVVFDYMQKYINEPYGFSKKNGWDAAGSTNLESDIDITIFKHYRDPNGGKTVYDYQMVKAFNDYFMKTFGAQPGIMFDTNLYASAPPEKKEVQTKTEKDIDAKIQGGQDVGALMKLRRYMSWDEYEDYRAEVIEEMKKAGAGKDEIAAANKQFDQADNNYQISQLAIFEEAQKMLKQINPKDLTEEQKAAIALIKTTLDKYADPRNTYQEGQNILLGAIQQLEKFQDVTMMVNNEIYTARIEKVRELEEEAKVLGDKIERDGLTPESPDGKKFAELLTDISQFKAEAVLFANEAYHSQGPFKHVVMATQAVGGDVENEYDKPPRAKGDFKKLNPDDQGRMIKDETDKRRGELSLDLCLQSFNEQMGDFLKDLKHYASEPFPGQGFYRSSKYLSRLFDALILLSSKVKDLNTGLSGDLVATKNRIDGGMLATRAGKLEFKEEGSDPLAGEELQHEIEAYAVDEIKAMFGVTNLADLGKVFKKVSATVNSQVRKAIATGGR